MAASLLAVAPAASAATFTVNQTGDEPDASGADGVCDHSATPGSQCTLRAAVDQGDFNPASNDTINFDPAVFNGETLDNINVDPSDNISIDSEMTISAGNCGTSSSPEPCVQADQDGTGTMLTVAADDVEIRGLALVNGGVGIFVPTFAANFTLTNSWFGIELGGAADPLTAGIDLQGDAGLIGGTAASDRNVFGNNGTAITLWRGDGNKIRGNYFGTRSDGSTAAPNSLDAIRIEGDSSGPDPAVANVIGATVSSSAAATTSCDGGCNLISRSGNNGIDLGADESGLLGADDTKIKGNFIGLDKTGTTALENNSSGIDLNESDGSLIGGETSADRNFITGGLWGIHQDPGSDAALVKRNFIGLDSAGTMPLDPPDVGVQAESAEDEPSTVARNRFAVAASPGTGLEVGGDSLRAIRNKFGLRKDGGDLPASTGKGIRVTGVDAKIGEPDAGNTIGNVGFNAIEINAGDRNRVQGNYIGVDSAGIAHPNTGGGVVLAPNDTFTSFPDDNLIGGGSGVNENVISNSGTDAIAIVDALGDSVGNEIKRNRGKDNGTPPMATHLFIDLQGVNGFGNVPSGPNNGIEAPTVDSGSATRSHLEGSGAKPGATIYIFRTSAAALFSPNRINAFVDTTVAGGSGNWSANFPQIPSGQRLTALQLDATDGSSELALAVAP